MKKRVKKVGNTVKTLEKTSSKNIEEDDLQLLKIVLDKIKKKYELTNTEVLNLVEEDVLIPTTIFTEELSPLETITKYLKENIDLSYTELAKQIHRERKSVWQAHRNALKKYPKKLIVKESKHNIPISEFKENLSILESIVKYLREKCELNYHEIGVLLQRNERTIWTVYSRAKKK